MVQPPTKEQKYELEALKKIINMCNVNKSFFGKKHNVCISGEMDAILYGIANDTNNTGYHTEEQFTKLQELVNAVDIYKIKILYGPQPYKEGMDFVQKYDEIIQSIRITLDEVVNPTEFSKLNNINPKYILIINQANENGKPPLKLPLKQHILNYKRFLINNSKNTDDVLNSGVLLGGRKSRSNKRKLRRTKTNRVKSRRTNKRFI
jgi:hypothetical protein